MAQEKYAYGSNAEDLFADDDPLAELARIVGYDQPSTRSRPPAQRSEPEHSLAPAGPAAEVRHEPAFDLEDELLKEFERYDAPNLDPISAIPVDAPVADHWSDRAEVIAPRIEPSSSGRFAENPAPFPAHSRPQPQEPVARSPLEEIFALTPVDEPSFEVDLADELELAVAAANDDEARRAPVVEARADGPQTSAPVIEQAARREPSFVSNEAVNEAPAFVEQPEPVYDVRHFDSREVEEISAESVFEVAPEPSVVPSREVAAVASRREPDLAGFDEVVAEDEFDLALDGLEIDLSDIVLDEVEAAVPVEPAVVAVKPPVAASVAPVAAAPVWIEPSPTFQEESADGDMPFDASQIAEPDYGPESVADLHVPEMPVHEADEAKPYRPAFDNDFDAELAELIHDDRAVSAAVAKPVEVAQQPKPSAVDLDDFSLMMNEDFREDANSALGAERYGNRVVIDPDNMEVIEPEGRNRVRGWLLAAAASVGVLASAGGVYAWLHSGGVSGLGNGGPPVVLADPEPVKVVPENPGGKTVPNQDKAVYDRVAGGMPQTPTQKSLISSSEEPLDVVQRTLTPENFPLDRGEDEAMAEADQRLQPNAGQEASAEASADANVSLRKVRTMIVRPDGTLVAREVPETQAPATAAAQPSSQTAARLPASSSATASAHNGATSAPAAAGTTPHVEAPAVSNDALSQAAASKVTDNRPASANGDRAPVPVQRPAEQPVNIVGTVTGNGNVRPAGAAAATSSEASQQVAAATPAATTAAATPAGAYVVQIASLPTQADAEKSAKVMAGKYGSVIGGRGLDIKAADIPGKGTFYRVRVVASSKDEANALCTKLKAAGGSCLVTR